MRGNEFHLHAELCCSHCSKSRPAASAHRSPSIPADTMPPAYPDPSPQGNSPFKRTCCKVSLSLTMRTGADVRVSTPIMAASLVRKPWLYFPNCWKPLLSRSAMNGGIQKCRGDDTSPGAYELSVAELFPGKVRHALRGGCLLHVALLPAEAFQSFLKIHHVELGVESRLFIHHS